MFHPKLRPKKEVNNRINCIKTMLYLYNKIYSTLCGATKCASRLACVIADHSMPDTGPTEPYAEGAA